jgi:hypothetical protein
MIRCPARHLRYALLLALALSASGCGALPGERQVKQFLGLEQPFAHNDVPPPPSPSAYVLQLGMSQTHRIVVRARPGRPQYEVTDPQVIAAVITVLRAGPLTTAAADAGTAQEPLQLDFIAGPPDRVVSAHYNPRSQILQLSNVPAAAWPDHAVGRYTMAPGFGAALLDILE